MPTRTTLAIACVAVLLVALVGILIRSPGGQASIDGVVIEGRVVSATATFTTSLPRSAHLDLTPKTKRTRVDGDSAAANSHRFEIAGLSPGTEYTATITLDDGQREIRPFRTPALLVENIRKKTSLNGLELSWTTSAPVRSSVVWRSVATPAAGLDLVESPGTTHATRITGLDPNQDYELTLVSQLEDGRTLEFGPIAVRSLRSSVREFLAEFDRSHFEKRVFDVLWQMRQRRPDQARVRELLGASLDPLRRPLGLVKPISDEFFTSPEVLLASKVKIYHALKMIEHLERVAAAQGLPLIPLLTGLEWGCFRQADVSLLGGARPSELEVARRDLLPSDPARPEEGRHIEEWRGRDDERNFLEVTGMVRDVQETVLVFQVHDPARIRRAEFRVVHRPTLSKIGKYRSRLHFIELNINGKLDLVVRIPPLDPRPDQPTVDFTGFDPAILLEGDNTVRVRVKSCPPLVGEGARFVRSVELRTLRGDS